MIYEKKGYLTKSIQFENGTACPSEAKNSITQYKKEDVIPYIQKPESYLKLKRTVKKRHKQFLRKGLLSKISVIFVTLLFGLFVTDSKYFDGAFFNNLCSSVQHKFIPMFKSIIIGQQQQSASLSSFKNEETETKYSDYNFEQIPYNSQPELPITADETSETNHSEISDENEPLAVISPDNSTVSVDGEIYYPITELDLSADSVAVLSNNTSYKPDMSLYIESENRPSALQDIVINQDEPLVLIVHTHGSECYTESEGMYPAGENTRSEDINKNVVRVGTEISNTLEIYGIPVLHVETMCDKESFIDAYNVSNRIVREALEKYPSIRIVIDVHRDAIIRNSGESIKPTVTVAGQEYAQLMFVVGTDEAGYNHPKWRENLAFAAHIQESAEERYPGLFRPINLRPVPFNQWLSDGYILLEVGSNANTLDEAILSAQAFGHTLGALIKEA